MGILLHQTTIRTADEPMTRRFYPQANASHAHAASLVTLLAAKAEVYGSGWRGEEHRNTAGARQGAAGD